ncbi:dephospho-CoA kinase [Nonlabens antarcticus]|uniref:dephospho-CoA kinase n=1 Tax=Nonlabens antarcticus TaxID=392714 RepID=UPI0018915CC0|nr:dephospho-CoA kinase [Nonlabens antarcticus]
MKVVGLTGGIGSGKSTIAREFQKLGVPIYIADEESKKILNTHSLAIDEIKQLLGSASYTNENGTERADKEFIALKVFGNPDLLKGLNAILHPKVKLHFEGWMEQQKSKYVIYEAAILLETGGDKNCDVVLLVSAPENERITRVMERDKITEQEVRVRLKNQWSENERLEKSDFIILNDDLNEIPIKVNKFHEFMLNK